MVILLYELIVLIYINFIIILHCDIFKMQNGFIGMKKEALHCQSIVTINLTHKCIN